MRTLLLFPPQAHFTQPYLALPSLKAYLAANGFPDTHQRDLNLESLEYFLSRERLALARDRVRERLAEYRGDRDLPLEQMDRFRTLAEADLAADSVVAGIDDAIAVLRDEERFHDYDEYVKAVKRLDRAFKLISAEWYPTVLSPNSFAMRHSIERETEVLEAIGNEAENLYVEFFRERVIDGIVALRPDLIGISITYGSMIIPAFTLARMIKEALPSVHITVGGGLLAYAGPKIAKSGAVFDVIDSLVMLEGEGPLLGIAGAVAEGRDVEDVSNVYWRRDGVVVRNETAAPVDIDSLPVPDFEGLPLDRYFSPNVAIPLAITRGCYYEKCVFCTLYKVIGPGYRQRNLEKILDDIQTLTTKWKSRYVYFVVEDMPPVLFRALPDALERRGIDIEWWTDARLERNLYSAELCRRLHAAGCRRIAFGFESANQRVLDLMEKGTAIAESASILKNVTDAGIAVVLYTMIGFPTETEDEARQTLSWIREHRDLIQEVSLRIFYIDLLSTVYAHPERFAITRVLADDTKDYQVYYDHESDVGMSRADARRVFFDFMEVVRHEFPLFQGDNLWLFELKSHHFLWLCRQGRLDVFEGRSAPRVARVPAADFDAARPRLAPEVVVRELPYDLTALARTLLDAEDRTLRPRYQSGSFKSEMIAQLGDEIEAARPKATRIAYRGETSDLIRIGADAGTILASLDGSRDVAAILEGHPRGKRDAVRAFLASLFERGLVEDTASRFEASGVAAAKEVSA
jgi:anaerobic magnesium-protoporphyrin IX monomethyl ester cyclase